MAVAVCKAEFFRTSFAPLSELAMVPFLPARGVANFLDVRYSIEDLFSGVAVRRKRQFPSRNSPEFQSEPNLFRSLCRQHFKQRRPGSKLYFNIIWEQMAVSRGMRHLISYQVFNIWKVLRVHIGLLGTAENSKYVRL
jgi:hypothetical protein